MLFVVNENIETSLPKWPNLCIEIRPFIEVHLEVTGPITEQRIMT